VALKRAAAKLNKGSPDYIGLPNKRLYSRRRWSMNIHVYQRVVLISAVSTSRLQRQVVAMAISRATCAHAPCANLEARSGDGG